MSFTLKELKEIMAEAESRKLPVRLHSSHEAWLGADEKIYVAYRNNRNEWTVRWSLRSGEGWLYEGKAGGKSLSETTEKAKKLLQEKIDCEVKNIKLIRESIESYGLK